MAFAVRYFAICGSLLVCLTVQASPATLNFASVSHQQILNAPLFIGRFRASTILLAQEGQVEARPSPKGTPQPASGPVKVAPGQPNGQPSQGTPPSKEGEAGKAKDDKSEGDKKDAAPVPTVVTRPLVPEQPGDPKQLLIVPDSEGRVRFNFAGQKWRDVLEWLASVSHLSLDWQELPGDYLNLRTQRDYTLPEAQDLINRHLLARGFTMIKSGEILTITSIAKLNPAFVPRVEPEDLENRMDYEFVKVSFPLKWILAERVVEEIKPMLSSNGKISALKEINRFEAMDAAVNLKEIARMLQQEQSQDASKGTLVKEFKLQHRRAGDVILMLESILGLDKNRPGASGGGGRGDGMSAQIMQQMQQIQQQMQQQQQRGDGGAKGAAKTEEPKLIVNERENSILAHAPPDKMEVIEQTIKAIDVAGDGPSKLLQDVSRVKPYRLSTLDPLPLVQLLKEMGDLSPQSRIQVDAKNKAVILYGTLADHYTVQTLIERLDGSDRNFEVIQLRRVQADAVAGTIQYMLGAEEKEKGRSNSRSMYSYFYNPPAQEEEGAGSRPFKIDADIEHNRLLVWANESELGEIRQLLVKMGEILPGTSNPDTVRTFQLNSEDEARKILERVRQLWPEVEPNELLIQPVPTEQKTEHPASAVPQTKTAPADHSEARKVLPSHRLRLVADPKLPASDGGRTHPLAEPISEEIPLSPTVVPETVQRVDSQHLQQRSSPPITIRQGANGKLIIGSADTSALDRLEDLLGELTPPARDYQIFQLRYPSTWAYGVELNLKAFFKDTSNEETVVDPYWGSTYTTKKNEKQRLSRKKELKIISDDDSHTILVQGATPQQLSTIADLIQVYDAPTAGDPQSVRRSQIFRLEHSKAEVIADTIKQVYRDLLSANDPSLQSNNQNQQQKATTEKIYSYRIGGGQNENKEEDQSKPPVKYKGLLSVGFDDISNSVVVSAGEELLAEIGVMVKSLDEAAHPRTNIQVMQVRNLDTSLIKDHLDKTFAPVVRSSKTGKQKPLPQNSQPQNQQVVEEDD